MALLEIRSISKSFPGRATPILHDCSFHVARGEIVCLLGPSGCGKTTLLRIIAGLEQPDVRAGQDSTVLFEGRPLEDVPTHRRGIGLMFQDYALFPHKDVAANISFGLQAPPGKGSRAQIEARVAEMLALVGLSGYERRKVYDLSGGEQQRVALARSLAPGPRLLMLDEPLGSLDRALREGLMNELHAILKRVGVTAIYVTHDQQEAFAVADRVILMDRGRIVQEGAPQAVYRQPASTWAARFLGLINLVAGQVLACDPLQVDTPLGPLPIAGSAPIAGQIAVGAEVTVLIRPEAARLAADCLDAESIQIEGTVRECSFRGTHHRLVVRCSARQDGLSQEAGIDLVFELSSPAARSPQPGEAVALAIHPEAISLLPQEPDEKYTVG